MILTLCLSLLSFVVPQSPADELAKDVDAFKDVVADRNSGDAAIPYIDKFLSRYKTNAEAMRGIDEQLELKEGNAEELKKRRKELEKEQKLLADTVWLTFASPARKQVTDDNKRLWTTSAFAFGQMGSHGAAFLLQAAKQDRFDKLPDLRAQFVEQIGNTKHYTTDKDLVDYLDHYQDVVIAGAAKAIGQFGEAPGKTRQFLVENLVKKLESYANAASNIEDTTSVQKYTTVRGPMIQALKNLTPMSFDDPLDWTKWWNNNKNKPELWK